METQLLLIGKKKKTFILYRWTELSYSTSRLSLKTFSFSFVSHQVCGIHRESV